MKVMFYSWGIAEDDEHEVSMEPKKEFFSERERVVRRDFFPRTGLNKKESVKQTPAESLPDQAGQDEATLLYLRSVGYRPLFSEQLEAHLVEQAQHGNVDAASKLIESHLRLIVSIARTYLHSGERLIELVNVGKRGFATALEGYSQDKQMRFLSYATWHIRHAIELKISRSDDEQMRVQSQGLNHLFSGSRNELISKAGYYTSLDELFNGVIGTPLSRLVGPEWRERAEGKLEEWLANLPVKQQELLSQRFGLGSHQIKTLSDISKQSGESINQLRALQLEALSRLKAIVRSSSRKDRWR